MTMWRHSHRKASVSLNRMAFIRGLAACLAYHVMTIAAVSGPADAVAGTSRSADPVRVLRAEDPLEERIRSLDGRLEDDLESREAHRRRIEEIWNDRLESGQKHRVIYGSGLQERVTIQFEDGYMVAEALLGPVPEAELARARLHKVIADALEWREPTGSGRIEAVLRGQLTGLEELQGTADEAASKAWGVIESGVIEWEDVRDRSGAQRTKARVRVPFVTGHLEARAGRYRHLVERYAREHNVDPNLVMAIMRVESAFNPRAVSSANALGLMQVVPTSAGIDAARLCPDLPGRLTREHYFDPEINIQLGCAYLHILKHRMFGEVGDDRSRLYMTISAYNGGPGGVARALSGERSASSAVRAANGMSPDRVYEQLIRRHPFRETREYLPKVMAALPPGHH